MRSTCRHCCCRVLSASFRAGLMRARFPLLHPSAPKGLCGMADLSGPLTARENSTHVARSVALALPSLIPPSALSPRLPISKWHCILYGRRTPLGFRFGALNETQKVGTPFSLKDLRFRIGARIKRQPHPKEDKTTEYLASHRLFPATTTCPRFIYGNAPSRRERERRCGGDVKESGRRPHCTTSCDSAIRAAAAVTVTAEAVAMPARCHVRTARTILGHAISIFQARTCSFLRGLPLSSWDAHSYVPRGQIMGEGNSHRFQIV